MGLAEALPGPLVGSLLFLRLLDASSVGRAGANGSESMGEKGRERGGSEGGIPKEQQPLHPTARFGRSCSSYDGVRVSGVGMDSLEPARQGQAQDPPALCSSERGQPAQGRLQGVRVRRK